MIVAQFPPHLSTDHPSNIDTNIMFENEQRRYSVEYYLLGCKIMACSN